ncbi:MAG TPA: hypothetical protein VGX16_05985 [Solirubrobacteraceae bacterium]|nr:hypothetical protein [Solirubrobacteraceae bacterium]
MSVAPLEVSPPPVEACPLCSTPLGPTQEWCLSCGAAARTRLAPTPRWRPPLIALGAVILLALGIITASLIKLSEGTKTSPVTTVVGVAPVPGAAHATTTPAPAATTPAPATTTPAPAPSTGAPPSSPATPTPTSPATGTSTARPGQTTVPTQTRARVQEALNKLLHRPGGSQRPPGTSTGGR